MKLHFFILLFVTCSLLFHAPLPEASAAVGDITPIRIQNHAAFESASANTEHDTTVAEWSSFIHVDSDIFALAYTGTGGDEEITDKSLIKALKTKVRVTWCGGDVYAQAISTGYKPTADEVNTILDRLERHHDATIGINWDVIDWHISDVIKENK